MTHQMRRAIRKAQFVDPPKPRKIVARCVVKAKDDYVPGEDIRQIWKSQAEWYTPKVA